MNPHDRWFDGVTRDLIRHAARKAPPGLSERLGEEWLADLSARAGALSQLRFALGCCWATTVIAHEFGAPVRAAAAAGVNKPTVDHHAGFGPSFSRRTMVILLIVGFHVFVVCVLAAAIEAPTFFKPSPPRMDVTVLPRSPPPVAPAPVEPKFVSPTIYLPAPPGPVAPIEQAVTLQGPATPVPPAAPPGAPLPKPVIRVLGGPGAGFPNTDDFYPEPSRRLGEKGITTLDVCVDGAGRLMGAPTVDQSSGSTRLDEAALKLARAGSGHYRATTEDGRPVSACYPLRVRFVFRD